MTKRRLVILHGWSDTHETFRPLARLLGEALGHNDISIISLAHYLTMEDEVRFDDIVTAMKAAWDSHRLPTEPGSVDAVVHSTGGLVIRDWLQRNFEPDSAPIKHLVMLAPANFGSPLAHKGRSFIARAYKGFIEKRPKGNPFETGTHILKGLELGSPYTWRLADRDRFGPSAEMYQPGRVLCTVLVGNTGYGGISSIANENGSDGTVRLSTANMDCVRIKATFPADPDSVGHDVKYDLKPSSGSTAFGVMDGYNHRTITLARREGHSLAWVRNRTKLDAELLARIVKGLTVTDDGFGDWRKSLERGNKALLPSKAGGPARKHGFQNTVIRVMDQYGVGVPDYLLEFYEKDDDKVAQLFHRSAIENVHKYSDDESYRCVYVNCTRLQSTIDKVGEHLSISLTAFPERDEPGTPVDELRTPVGFTTIGDDGIGGIRIPRDKITEFFVPHRTALVTLTLTRQQSSEVFRWKPPDGSPGEP